MPAMAVNAAPSNGPSIRAVTRCTAFEPEVLEPFHRHEAPAADDTDAVSRALHVIEEVRGQKTVPPRPVVSDHRVELVLHQRVETAGRLVEHDEIWGPHERLNDDSFCLLPFDRGPPVVRGPDPGGLPDFGGRASLARGITEPREVRERCATSGAPRGRVLRAHSRFGSGRGPVTPRVDPEHLGSSPTSG